MHGVTLMICNSVCTSPTPKFPQLLTEKQLKTEYQQMEEKAKKEEEENKMNEKMLEAKNELIKNMEGMHEEQLKELRHKLELERLREEHHADQAPSDSKGTNVFRNPYLDLDEPPAGSIEI